MKDDWQQVAQYMFYSPSRGMFIYGPQGLLLEYMGGLAAPDGALARYDEAGWGHLVALDGGQESAGT